MAEYGPFGGHGGNEFDDATIANMDQLEIGEITIRADSGRFINSIEILYRNPHTGELVPSDHHGGPGGTENPPIVLNPGEYIVEISGRETQFVDSLTLQTNQGRTFGRFGGLGGTNDYDAPSRQEMNAGNEVFAFFGRSGEFLDAIGIHTRPRQLFLEDQ
jgi:hypothetical protein